MSNYKLHLISFIAFCTFIFLAYGSDDSSNSITTESDPVKLIEENNNLNAYQKDSLKKIAVEKEIEIRKNQTIKASDLIYLYDNNEVKADNDFKDKTFYVEGIINDIGKDILDDIYVTLKGSNESFREVQCYINNPSAVASLSKGQFITVKGKCKGLMMNVLFYKCRIVENQNDLK